MTLDIIRAKFQRMDSSSALKYPITRDDIEQCRRLVSQIDNLARQTGAYEVEQRWTNPSGAPVYDITHLTGPDSVTPELLAELPRRAYFFTGWTSHTDSSGLGLFDRVLWRILSVSSASFAMKALWKLRLIAERGGPPLELLEMITAKYARGLPTEYVCTANFDGTPLDRLAVQERMRALYRSGLLEHLRNMHAPTIFEIGGGYGALALAIKQVVPQVNYVIVDLPHSLYMSACYLATRQRCPVIVESGQRRAAPIGSFQLVLSTMLDSLAGLSINLAINTLSFGEMAENEVERYGAFIRQNLAPDGALFEQNFDNSQLSSSNFSSPERALSRHFQTNKRVPGIYLKGEPRVWRAST